MFIAGYIIMIKLLQEIKDSKE